MIRSTVLQQLADHILLTTRPHPLRVAIDGIDAAGKTTLANELAQILQNRGRSIIQASIDGFHNPRATRYKRGYDSPDGYYFDSFDYPAIIENLLEPLGANGSRQYRTAVFDFQSDLPIHLPLKQAPEQAILLFDGVFLFRVKLSSYWDYKIFVDIEFNSSVERASVRDQYLLGEAEAIRKRYWQRYVPGQQLYIRRNHPQEQANAIIKNDDPQNPTLQVRA